MYKITKKFEFSAAHHLPNYKGSCENVHGHNYSLEVCVAGEELDEIGILIDFKDLKKIVQENILSKLNHTDLNEIKDPTAKEMSANPTAENIAKWIYEHLKPLLQTERYALDQIAIWETATSCAVYKEK